MNLVAGWPSEDRKALFQETATCRALTPAVVEKDFWVCWVLGKLFEVPQRAQRLLFKGGTSLSKVYGVIERFSEDVDLTIDRRTLGFTEDRDPASSALSGKQAKKLLEELSEECQREIEQNLLPAFRGEFTAVLGPEGSWQLALDEAEPQTILFHYPSGLGPPAEGAPAYIRPVVRLEVGVRGEVSPSEERLIRSYAAEHFPEQFQIPECSVRVLNPERTFWEKATILHAEYHRPADKTTGDRLSRHYYDLVQLFRHEIGQCAIKRRDLLAAVVEHKRRFFASAWANYKTAQPGTLRLVPTGARRAALEEDYRKMREMFFHEPPSFDELIDCLGQLETIINDLSAG